MLSLRLLPPQWSSSTSPFPSLKTLTATPPCAAPRRRPLPRTVHQAVTKPREETQGASRALWKAAVDFKWIRDNRDAVAANIKNRNSNADLDLVLKLYEEFCGLQKEVERLRGERNTVANKMKGKLEASERQALVEEGLLIFLSSFGRCSSILCIIGGCTGKNLKEELTRLEEGLVQLTDRLQVEGQSIPNITHPDVPIGGEESSAIRKMVGKLKEFNFPIKDHLQLGKELDIFDFDAAAEKR